MAWVYILRCGDGSYYVGSTIDLERRLAQHQVGEGAAYTRRRRPVELMWAAQFASVRDAYLFEKRVQRWRRAKREALIDGREDLLPLLANRSWSAQQAQESGELPSAPTAPAPEPVMAWDVVCEPADAPDDPWAPPVPRAPVDLDSPPLPYTRILPGEGPSGLVTVASATSSTNGAWVS